METVLREGSKTNEDLVTVTDGAAWVLDGASGFSDRDLFEDAETDGRWYVEAFDEELRRRIDDASQTLDAIVGDAIEAVALRMTREMTIPEANGEESADPKRAVDPLDIPGATVAIVRWNTVGVETYSLGDSTVLVSERGDEGVSRYFHGDPSQFDEVSNARLGELREEHPEKSRKEIREMAQETFERVRLCREMPGGYWALGVNPLAARMGVSGRHLSDETEAVYLFTDGLADLVPKFEVYETWGEAAEAMDEHGVESVVSELREVEAEADDYEEVPRGKVHDDVGVVRVEFEGE